MADLDTELSNRLSRLSAAVPVSATHLDPVHRTAVQARQRVRMAWVTPLAVIVAVGLILGLTKLGSSGPRASATARTVLATDSRGAFSLTIRSAKAVYRPDEPIDVEASLAFAGPALSVTISHALGANDGPLGFGVVEPVDVSGVGWIQLGGGYRLACVSSRLQQVAPISAPYSKGGGPLLEGPDGPTIEQLQAYMSDRVLRLPGGTWHVYAVADFTTGGCGASGPDRYQLRAEITVVVADDPNATPGAPQTTPFLNQPVYGGDDIGDFTMQLMSGRSFYAAGAPIDIAAWYTFGSGVGNSVTVSHFAPEVEFSISQVTENAQVVRSTSIDSACQEVVLTDGQERHVALTDNAVLTISAADWPSSTANALKDGLLMLPVGRWRITAVVATTLAACGAQGESRQLHTSIEFDVVDPADPKVAATTGT